MFCKLTENANTRFPRCHFSSITLSFKPLFLSQIHLHTASVLHNQFPFLLTMADEQNPSDALPDGWVAVTKEGSTVKYFTNIETHQTFNTREELRRYVAYASRANLPQRVDYNQPAEVRCTRCWCIGHTASECTCSDRLVKIYNEMLFGGANEKVRNCKRCGRWGHNIRNCHGPIFKH